MFCFAEFELSWSLSVQASGQETSQGLVNQSEEDFHKVLQISSAFYFHLNVNISDKL